MPTPATGTGGQKSIVKGGHTTSGKDSSDPFAKRKGGQSTRDLDLPTKK